MLVRQLTTAGLGGFQSMNISYPGSQSVETCQIDIKNLIRQKRPNFIWPFFKNKKSQTGNPEHDTMLYSHHRLFDLRRYLTNAQGNTGH